MVRILPPTVVAPGRTNVITVVEMRPSHPDVVTLIEAHQAAARLFYAPEDCHAETSDTLEDASTRMFATQNDGVTVAIGGYKMIGDGVAEVKSVFVDPDVRGLGAGKSLMAHLIAAARDAGITQLMLEAGTDTYAAPARALYGRLGFTTRAPFGAYTAAQASTFMECQL